MKLRRNQHPGGHKEGRASFPIQSQYKVSKIHTPNPTLEKKGRKSREREGGGAQRRGGSGHQDRRATEERVGERYLCPLTLELKD